MEGLAWRENGGLWFGHADLATSMRRSSRSINLGNCLRVWNSAERNVRATSPEKQCL